MAILLTTMIPLLVATAAQAAAPQVREPDLQRHISVLASDAYEGRKPGTAGETKTLQYLRRELAAAGLTGGAAGGGWQQPVPLVQRRPTAQRATWRSGGRTIGISDTELVLVGRSATERVADAPVVFVRGAAPLRRAEISGAVALFEVDPSRGSEGFAQQTAALAAAGAAAVIGVYPDAVPWPAVMASVAGGQDRLASTPVPAIFGAMPLAAALRLAGAPPGANVATPLPVRASLNVSTAINAYTSYNLIGRIRGTGRTGEAVLVLGHWDHLGLCGPAQAADRICNGAVDNASGMAMLIEAARHLARGRRPVRDILFMATTAEESGLLGAEHFVASKPAGIVAAINIDTVAIAGRGEPVAIVGRGTTRLDPLIDATARSLGRTVDTDTEANAFIQRQDGWALTRAGIPAVMIGGAFSSMAKLGVFLAGPYHKPGDDLSRPIELGGAAEDTELTIALVRKLADPAQYRPTAR